MWFLRAPAAVVGLVTVALLPTVASKPLSVLVEELSELRNATQFEMRQACAGTPCGYYNQLCCTNGESCSRNANDEAICVAVAAGASAGATGGSWSYSTVVITQTGVITQTSVFSTFIAATTGSCAASQVCNTECCQAGFYCGASGCLPIAGSTPGVTATGSPTATLPFSTPIPTGANGTLVESNAGGGGLSGGAIAGIVIGIILGTILLLLICFYCCAKSAFNAILAIFGLGKKRRTREETTYIEEHHHSGSAAAGGGRRWYGQGSSRPSRPPKKSGGGMGNLLGVGAGLAGLAAVLGMKRKNDRRHDDKSTTVSGSSYSYSDYTSSSSASSDDRRTRHTRHSSRR
ncbi:hypothetical protein K458DRAFT_415288 [Lentithecium fluviatile CBS 122367]|uniref:Mid2 domain-containing protein n=1 Tax=Lentithecium fluviatile CBS 122367 TaxID=1168545 RepID=A0A6G1JDF7_9PLEO|nr:hypothetical protein K458DRAFT_415288 [Lentithecium fluviatile CBS 122367]